MALTKVIGAGIGTVTNQFSVSNLPAGTVLQTVNTSFNTQTKVTATSYTDITNASLAITPNFSSSKILVTVNLSTRVYDGNTNYANGSFQILRGSTAISGSVPTDGSGTFEVGMFDSGGSSVEMNHRYVNTVLDSPSTTSATTYSVKMAVYGSAGGEIGVNLGGSAYGTSTIRLQEIAQ